VASGPTKCWRCATSKARLALAWLWAGQLLCVALLAAPNAFATLARPEAGAYVARLFLIDARISMVLGVLLLLMEQRLQREATPGRLRFTAGFVLPVAALLCVVGGYEALQPLLNEARGTPSFGLLHGVSMAAFAAKTLCVLALAGITTSSYSSALASRA
jgi:Domain of unknown function (DUF4149)